MIIKTPIHAVALTDLRRVSAGPCAVAPATERRPTRAERRGGFTEFITSTRQQHATDTGVQILIAMQMTPH